MGIKGAADRRFPFEIVGGPTVEKELDYSTGELVIGVTRNGEPSDALYRVRTIDTGEGTGEGTGENAARGRTYTSANSNPKTFELEPGEYRVQVDEIRGEKKEIRVKVVQGETVERMVDPAGGG